MNKRSLNPITRFILKHSAWVAAVGLLLGSVGGYYSVHLFSNLRTEIEELLPTDARAVQDLNEVRSRLESTNNLAVLVFSDHVKKSQEFVVDLARKLNTLPKSSVASVEYRIDQEIRFFEQRKSLFIDLSDLKKIHQFISDKIEYEKQLYNPLTIIENRSFQEPRLDIEKIQKKYVSQANDYTRFPDGFYATPDEKIRVMLVNQPGSSSGIEGAKQLRKAVDTAIAELNPKNYSPDLQVEFSGGVQDLMDEHEALIEDLALSTIVVCLLVGAAMILYFKSIMATLILVIGLLAGTLLTFGLGFFQVGYLNANSAFMGSIVIGNGINFGIILLARFIEERKKLKGVPRSIAIALQKTFPATIVAALAAGLSYGSLMLTSFRGFRQFGVIGLTGMLCCWIMAYTLIPALLNLAHRAGFFRKPFAESRAYISEGLVGLVKRFPKSILAGSLILTLASLSTLGNFDTSIIETDLKKLRSQRSMDHGSMYWGKYVDEVFQRYLSPVVALPHNRKDALAIAEEIKKAKAEQGDDSYIVKVSTIEDFVPDQQAEKIKKLRDIERLLPTRIFVLLNPSEQRLVRELLSPGSFRSFQEHDLPELILSKFREQNGELGKLVLVEPSLSSELARSHNLINFVKTVRDSADKIAPGTAVAGTLPVTADLFKSIVEDGPTATLFALVSVLLLVILLFRNTSTILLCSFALILGVLWMFGYILGFGEKINFLNFIALPITFGIGVDYGVNIFQRFRLEKKARILNVLKQTGGAVMLASLTTIIGYGSLMIASNRAFVSFGRLAILGEITCLIAAVISLPALLWVRERRNS